MSENRTVETIEKEDEMFEQVIALILKERNLLRRSKDAVSAPQSQQTAIVEINVDLIPKKIMAPELPRVNLKTDCRCFAYLDECCNRSCHSKFWRKDCVDKGMTFGILEGEARNFKGLGGAVALGRRKLTIGIESVNHNNTPYWIRETSSATKLTKVKIHYC